MPYTHSHKNFTFVNTNLAYLLYSNNFPCFAVKSKLYCDGLQINSHSKFDNYGTANGGKFEFFFRYLRFYLKYLVNAGIVVFINSLNLWNDFLASCLCS